MADPLSWTMLLTRRCPSCQVVLLMPATDDGWEACAGCGRMYRVDLDTTPPTATERMPVGEFAGRRADCAEGLRVVVDGETVDLDRNELGIATIPGEAEWFEVVWT